MKHLGYGDLEKIVIVTLPADPFFAALSGKTISLVLIVPWDSDGRDAAKENVYMTTRRAAFVTELQNLQAVVGLVETRRKWGIIDRSGDGFLTNLVEDEMAGGFASEDVM